MKGLGRAQDFLAKVGKRFAETEPGRWVTGRGWIETFWDPPTFPTAADLDKVAPGSPVFLTRADGHAAIVNTAALQLAGITAETLAPFGGEILKDKATGQPTGMLIDNAKELVARYIPAESGAEKEDALLRGVKREIELGWCEIQNPGSDLAEVEIMRRLFDRGQLKLRIYNAVSGPGGPADQLLTEGASIRTNGGRFTQRTIKFYADGALGSRGAALLEKYADADTSGFLTNKPETLRAVFEQALRRGIQVQTHAIGDRANRIVLDLYAEVFKRCRLTSAKWPSRAGESSTRRFSARKTSRGSPSSASSRRCNRRMRSATYSLRRRDSGRHDWPARMPGGAC